MSRIAHEDEIVVYCPRELSDGPCEAEITLLFEIEPIYPGSQFEPPSGGERSLISNIPTCCSRLHLFTLSEQADIETQAEKAMDGYNHEDSDDRY